MRPRTCDDLGRRKVTMKERKPDGPGALSRADQGRICEEFGVIAVLLSLRLRKKQDEELADATVEKM
jgi:hypothetical protein